ncbi:MAG: hypothetical protein A3D92_08965 [Bacteroidetes bacterium RIFCSPHIGHO2_02_FULL_44_7]|nr:MAG: hypothetical protein A3D92_08965 [Bacteroidetes bacterium RIFCSPHIGHO2_02_FULL_44_7]
MGYAISFLLLIGLICTSVLFITSANKRLEMNYLLDEHMLLNNYVSLHYGAGMQEAGSKIFVHSSGDTSEVTVRNWGAFRAVTSWTHHGGRLVEKSAIVGRLLEEPLPVLYLPNRKQVVKLCGKTLIEGEVYSSSRGFERGHIANSHFEGDKLLHSTLRESERELPKLKSYVHDLDYEHLTKGAVKIEPLRSDSSFRFTQATSLMSSTEAIHVMLRLEGNLIIHSFDSIFVSATASLNHVILMAPIIRFEKGFHGCVQAIANERISCEEGVELRYPSALILEEKTSGDRDRSHGIFVEKKALVLGGILLLSENPNFRHPVHLLIDEATVGGLVYNVGESELKGSIIGSLYTNELALKLGGGEYKGYFWNATLSSKQLPEEFVLPDWLADVRFKESKLLACF